MTGVVSGRFGTPLGPRMSGVMTGSAARMLDDEFEESEWSATCERLTRESLGLALALIASGRRAAAASQLISRFELAQIWSAIFGSHNRVRTALV